MIPVTSNNGGEMINIEKAIATLNKNAEILAMKYKYGNGQCARYVKAALISGGASSAGSDINAAKDYGAWLESIGFEADKSATTINTGGVYSVSSQRAGDVVVIQNAPGHQYGHMTMFNGTSWVSDYVQDKGFYPAQVYRDQNTKYVLYHYKDTGSENMQENSSQKSIINFCYPVRKESGQEFNHTDEILAHLEGESTGFFMIGRNGMWHGGIHITDATTPWCALSGKGEGETAQYNGQQAVRCMADGEVVAYRLCKNYIPVSWISGPLSVSGSFVLVRHYIQPGKTEKSGLHFYTLYMHLAPYSAYPQDNKLMKVADGQQLNAYIDDTLLWCVRSLPGGTRVSWDTTDAATKQNAKNGRQYARVTLVDGLEGNPALSAGDRVWIVCDRGKLVPEDDGPVRPAWWAPLLASAKDKMQFDSVVCVNEPFAIAAGAPVGHMGFVQAPTDAGTESRYQVHIECLSMDDNLENFLTNPEAAGIDNPMYIRCTPGLALYQQDLKTGFIKTTNSTKEDTFLLLSQVPVETGGSRDKPEQYYHFPEGFVLKGETSPERLSQYDLGKLGFTVMKDTPESFVHLDGKKQPKGLVRQLYEKLLEVSQKDRRVSNALDPHNYRRLLNKIDSNRDGLYSPEEYRRAVHNPSYRDTLYKTIVMHPSDWYYRSDEDMWSGFIKTLEKYAPDWVPYTQQFTDRLCWMQELKKLKLGPVLWHMHPIVFLGSLIKRDKIIWMKKFTEKFGVIKAEAFRTKLLEVSRELNIDANYIMACIALETGKTFRTDIKNPGSSATGLIQFMDDTAKDLGTSTRKLRLMNHVEQMEYVKKYFKMQADNVGVPTEKWTLEDVYYSIFRPKTILLGPNDIVYETSDGDYYSKNLYHDRNSDGKITKNEIAENIRINYKLGIPEAG
ncbi:hypothetical protein SM094_003911 [Cronobacter malonaticus]|nr:hypothetical protein [Cronobacter malonaticus]